MEAGLGRPEGGE